jgi:hypothetical protein
MHEPPANPQYPAVVRIKDYGLKEDNDASNGYRGRLYFSLYILSGHLSVRL